MAHLLCITGRLIGLLNATCALAAQLEEAGHEVTVASPADLRAHVETRGLRYAQLDDRQELPREPGSVLARLRRVRQRRDRAVAALGVDRLPDIVREIAPDGVLIDIELHAHVIATVPLGLPTALLCQFVSIRKRPGVPPLHRTVVPRGWRGGRAYTEWCWARYRARKWFRAQRSRIKPLGVDRVSVLRHLARRTGFSFHDEVEHHEWLIPFSYRRLPIIYLAARELDFPHDPAPHVHYAGPLAQAGRREQLADVETARRLETIFARRRSEPGRALVLCSMSSVAPGDPEFLRRLIDAVAGEPGWDVLIGLGGRTDPAALGPLPANVHVVPWVPQMLALEHADCAVINAGINTLNECILMGVPLVVFSLDVNDQNGNAARVAYHGLGVVADLGDRSAAMHGHIRRVLEDDSYKARVTGMQTHFQAYPRERRAVRVVEELLLAPEARGSA